MSRQTTSTRLKQIMAIRNLRQIDILNMSKPYQEELKINMSKSHLSQYVNGKSKPDQGKLFLLGKTLNINEPWLMGYDVPMERVPDDERQSFSIEAIYNQLSKQRQEKVYNFAEEQLEEQQSSKSVPIVGTTAANPTALSYGDPVYDEFVDTAVPRKADAAFVIQGDSMEPDFKDRTIVFYRRQPTIENGELAIVELSDGVTFKRVCFDDESNKVRLKSINDKYEDRIISNNELKVIGKVVK